MGGKKDRYGFGRGELGAIAWVGWALNNGSGDKDSPFLQNGDLGNIPFVINLCLTHKYSLMQSVH